MENVASFEVKLAWRRVYCGVKKLVKDGVVYYFIDNEYYFARKTLYGEFDDGERYAFFCMSVLEMLDRIGFYPDVLHAHDWQAALSVIYLNCLFKWRREYGNIKTVFTIHNIEYQGYYSKDILNDVFALNNDSLNLLEYNGCLNLMKGAIVCADIVSTVSPRYADEIRTSEYSHGLHYIINQNHHKLRGILNGIDYDYYNPETDGVIAANFSVEDLSGKYTDKKELQNKLGLPEREDVPLLAIISRLAAHKGLDLVAEMVYGLLENNDVQLVVLGKGEKGYEDLFTDLQNKFPEKARALIVCDRALATRIYAA
jgi:starch synthase